MNLPRFRLHPYAAMGVTPEMRDAAALAAEALGEEDYEDLA
ncbi:hypothetical protein [Collinsella tanakaei]|nr:hypothetical protein [Collinsella tanakaei]